MQTSKASATPASMDEASEAVVLSEISGMVEQILGEYGLGNVELTSDATFFEDLGLESIDLVVLAGHLEARYGNQVNVAEFIATLEFNEIIGLTVGRLVDHVVACLLDTGEC